MQTLARSQSPIPRASLARRYRANRLRSRALFSIARPEAYLDRPIALRLPIVFYDGHMPAFSFNTLIRKALDGPSINPYYEELFERGIDPATVDEAAPRHTPGGEWPTVEQVAEYGRAVDGAILDALATADLTDARRSPLLERAQAAYTILEHEEMHHETLLYILHRLPLDRKRPPQLEDVQPRAAGEAVQGRIAIPAGRATLGARRDDLTFGWDNEFDETTVGVGAFDIDAHSVTNTDWLAFVRSGGPVPGFWLERDGEFELVTQFEHLALPGNWPVYVTHAEATAYAAWRGARLPTEAEYHRAAFGTPGGEERPFPWGADAPRAIHGNFGLRRYDPEPIGSSPAGASAWGVHDLMGNGWEWTSTPFEPLPGFAPMASYPQYSADFFDGTHYVMKGASPATSRHHVRRSFRNWFRDDYPFMYAKFRLVSL